MEVRCGSKLLQVNDLNCLLQSKFTHLYTNVLQPPSPEDAPGSTR